jgi:hypothetical protein
MSFVEVGKWKGSSLLLTLSRTPPLFHCCPTDEIASRDRQEKLAASRSIRYQTPLAIDKPRLLTGGKCFPQPQTKCRLISNGPLR